MVSIKERKVKGKVYVYVSASASFKGEIKRFEKSAGPKDMDPEILKRKKDLYSFLLEQKRDYYLMYLEIRNLRLKYLTKGYAFPLIYIKKQYEIELQNYYPEELEKYQDAFDVRYIHHTTAIEGNTLTLQETGLVLDKGIAPGRKKLREIHEVENYRKVLDLVRSYKKDINLDFMLKLHELIQKNIDDPHAGSFRKIPIFISGSNWEPPSAIVVKEELEDLLAWYNKKKKSMNPLELAGYFHHRFEQIHPFTDGNGRVGRELLNFILQKNGYPIIIIPVERREDYLQGLEKANDGDLRPLLEFLVEILVEDYARVIRNNLEKFIQGFGELEPNELKEIIESIEWFKKLLKRYIEKTPKHLMKILLEIING